MITNRIGADDLVKEGATAADFDAQPRVEASGGTIDPLAIFDGLPTQPSLDELEQRLRTAAAALDGADPLRREFVRARLIARLEELEVPAPARCVDAALESATAAGAGGGGTRHQAAEAAPDDPRERSRRPTQSISLLNRRLSEKSIDALRALAAANGSDPRLFQQSGALVRLRLDDEAPRVEILTADGLRGELDQAALWQAPNGTIADPPMSVVRNILALPSYDLPRLRAVAEAPFFTRDGQLVVTPRYHKTAETYLWLPPGLVIPDVPATPSVEDLRRAKQLLLVEVLGDFPFTDQASRAHAVGQILLPFTREMIPGPTPWHALDSPMPGTGKGLLADLVSIIATGRQMTVMTEAKNNDELRKLITAVLLSGTPFALFDNIVHRIDSPVLAAALTAPFWMDRVLGVSKIVRIPIRITWILTGNNIQFTRDHARRAVGIRIDAKTPMPNLRSGFRHRDIRAWVRQHRADLVWAALIFVQNWVAKGKPRFTTRHLGSFEDWSELIGGVLATAGIPGFLTNLEAYSVQADTETTEWDRFVSAWWETHKTTGVETAMLLPLAEAFMPEVLGDGVERSQRTRLGKALRKRVGWTFAVSGPAERTIVRLEEAEARDAEGRERNGWALQPQAETKEAGGNVGTLGGDSAPTRNDCTSGAPNVTPNVLEERWDVGTPPPTSPNVRPTTLGPMEDHADVAALRTRPNVPTLPHPGAAELSPACPSCGGTDFWRSRAGWSVCRECHPPAPGAEDLGPA